MLSLLAASALAQDIPDAADRGAEVAEGAVARPREAKQLNEPEQKYDFELSFPVDSDEATNVKDGRRARIESLLQSILLENEALVRSFLFIIC